MSVTRDVIRDLLPAYFSDEATEDTRRLVDDFFRQDPEFEVIAREGAQQLDSLGGARPFPADIGQEKAALARVHRFLRNQRRLFGLALTFSINAILIGLSFQISSEGQARAVSVHWLQLPFQRYLVSALGAAAVILWMFYFIEARRSHT